MLEVRFLLEWGGDRGIGEANLRKGAALQWLARLAPVRGVSPFNGSGTATPFNGRHASCLADALRAPPFFYGSAPRTGAPWLILLRLLFVGFAQIFRYPFVRGFHGLLALMPVHRADFSELFEVLQGVDHSDFLRRRAAEREVVDHLVLHYAVLVYEEQSAVCDHLPVHAFPAVGAGLSASGEDAIIARNRLVCIGNERILDPFDSPVRARRLNPREMAELGVGRAPYELDVSFVEFLFGRLEREDFRGADECEVLGV